MGANELCSPVNCSVGSLLVFNDLVHIKIDAM